MPIDSLTPEQLIKRCDPTQFKFKTTAELPASTHIIGQPRGTRAIEFGIGMQSEGYNIFVLGAQGTGRTTAIKHFLETQTNQEAVPVDWVYVHNFKRPHQPRALAFAPGTAVAFQDDMHRLIQTLGRDLAAAFDSDAYLTSIESIQQDCEQAQSELLLTIHRKAVENEFVLLETASGLTLTPTQDGHPLSAEVIQQLSATKQTAIEKQRIALSSELDIALHQMKKLDVQAQQQMKTTDHEVAIAATSHHIEQLNAIYAANPEVLAYLDAVIQDLLAQIDDFPSPVAAITDLDLSRYAVNLFVDNRQTRGAPVIVETNPTIQELFGSLEYELRDGVLDTHLNLAKCGCLHRANGGYLIINALDMLKKPQVWEALKRALTDHEIHIQAALSTENGPPLTKSLKPEPIPLDIKMILLGSAGVYYTLFDQDNAFHTLFKVRADFDDTMPRNSANEQAYAQFIATRCHAEKLNHFEPTGVTRIVEFGSRLAENRTKLSTHFGKIADLLREASYWATYNGRFTVIDADVDQALAERIYRSNLAEQELQEDILNGDLFVTTSGEAIGQVNGLSIYNSGDYEFGQPGRITARTFMGDNGVTHIERETQMSGPIHDKGVLTLYGYLGGMYAQNQPLILSASVTFEQTYGEVDGDSASSAELYALLSCLTRLPVKQSIAITGSVSQHGNVQPIGGVNEKIEGFFKICQARGLTGDQGVIIPAVNVVDLMLHADVVTAVSNNQFHIWAVQHIDEGLELLTGIPAGVRDADGSFPPNTVHHAAQERLFHLAVDLKSFGDKDDDDEEDDEENKEK